MGTDAGSRGRAAPERYFLVGTARGASHPARETLVRFRTEGDRRQLPRGDDHQLRDPQRAGLRADPDDASPARRGELLGRTVPPHAADVRELREPVVVVANQLPYPAGTRGAHAGD